MTNRAKGWFTAILLSLGLWMLALGLASQGDTVASQAQLLGHRLMHMIG